MPKKLVAYLRKVKWMKGGKGVEEGNVKSEGGTVEILLTSSPNVFPLLLSDGGNKIASPLQISCLECKNSRSTWKEWSKSNFRHTQSQSLPAGPRGDGTFVGDSTHGNNWGVSVVCRCWAKGKMKQRRAEAEQAKRTRRKNRDGKKMRGKGNERRKVE